MNKRKMLEQAVCNELCSMLSPGKDPYVPKKKQANIIMFVGLQGCRHFLPRRFLPLLFGFGLLRRLRLRHVQDGPAHWR